jgi:hypothetical protein
MEEQENGIHLDELGFKNNVFKTNNKRQGGRTGEVGVVILLTVTYKIYPQTAINLMTLLRTAAMYYSLGLWCSGNEAV